MSKLTTWSLLGVVVAAVMMGCESSPRKEVARVPAGSTAPQYEPTEPIAPGADGALTEPVVIQEQVIINETVDPLAVQPAPIELTAATPDVPETRIHTIKKGDTLWTIAKQYYGRGQDYPRILNANPGLVPEKMTVGRDIVIP